MKSQGNTKSDVEDEVIFKQNKRIFKNELNNKNTSNETRNEMLMFASASINQTQHGDQNKRKRHCVYRVVQCPDKPACNNVVRQPVSSTVSDCSALVLVSVR
jgi:hypothetical protein